MTASRRHIPTLKNSPRKRFPTTPKTLGDQIKVKRYEKGLTYDHIAAKLGVSAALVKDWEKDQIKPDENAWKALDRILGLDLRAFHAGNPT